MSRKSQVFAVVLLTLVGVGLATQLYNDAWGLLKSILIFGAIAAVLYFLVNKLLLSRGAGMSSSPTDKGYQKALRQQKQRNKMKQQGPSSTSSSVSTSPAKMKKMNRLKPSLRRDNPFRVIEGKKNKPNKKTKTS